jgi:hypothetical protein
MIFSAAYRGLTRCIIPSVARRQPNPRSTVGPLSSHEGVRGVGGATRPVQVLEKVNA